MLAAVHGLVAQVDGGGIGGDGVFRVMRIMVITAMGCAWGGVREGVSGWREKGSGTLV